MGSIDQNHYHSTAIVLGLRHHSVLAQTNPPINNWQHHPTTAHHVVRYNHHPRSPIASSSLAQMSMPGMSTSMDTAMSMPGAMSSGMTMTTTASSAKSSLMASATSTSSSSSATVSTNAAPGSTGPSEAMIAAIGLVTWVALGVSNVF